MVMSAPGLRLAYVDAAEMQVAYRMAGNGPALVLLHGFLCDSRCWMPQLTDLSDRFRVVAWDAPGAGSSADPTAPFTVTDWAIALGEFLDAIAIDRAHFLGLSWGGMLAQELYRLYPTRVDHLVLADTYAGWKGSLPPEIVEVRLARCYRDALRPPREVVAEWVPADFFLDASRELTAEMASVVADFHPVGFRLMATSLAHTDTTAVLPTIKAPTLLVWGDGDQRSPLTVAEQFHAAISGSELRVIHGAGHVSNMEKPDAFNATVRQFLTDA
ncbi:MAG: alpha/beta fold hydrolase [Chloroflexi bacterium]|nr:MAG: alpha/beta fold hydrolase [Chloroflexota bacterium]